MRAFGEEPMGVHHKENLGFRRSSRNVSLQTTWCSWVPSCLIAHGFWVSTNKHISYAT